MIKCVLCSWLVFDIGNRGPFPNLYLKTVYVYLYIFLNKMTNLDNCYIVIGELELKIC